MKRFIISLVLIFVILTAIANANSASIDVLSQLCEASVTQWDVNHIVVWNDSSPTGISSPYGNAYANANIGATEASLDVSAFLEGGEISAEILFHPLGASYIKLDNINAFGQGTGHSHLTLIDDSTNKMLFELVEYGGFDLYQAFPDSIPYSSIQCMNNICQDSSTGQIVGPYNYSSSSFLIPVDPTHSYLLKTWVSVLFEDCGEISATMSLIAVPEPCTMLLLGLGLMGLAGLRRKFNISYRARP